MGQPFEPFYLMRTRITVMLDGGHVRVHAKKAGKTFDPDYIEKIGMACAAAGEVVHRIMYYDCAPFCGSTILPVSGNRKVFNNGDEWLKKLFVQRLVLCAARGAQVPRVRS